MVFHIIFHFRRVFFTTYEYITNSHCQLLVGLTAQLTAHCTSITDVMGLNPIQAYTVHVHCKFFQA